MATDFVCVCCMRIMEEVVEPVECFYDGVETVKGFCYLGDRLNVSGWCEMTVTARLGWVKFRGKVFAEDEGKDISILCAICYALW